MGLKRLFWQFRDEFDVAESPHQPVVALYQPGLVDTPGPRAHLEAASANDLPHSDYLADALHSGNTLTAEQTGAAICHLLFETSDGGFHGQEIIGRELIDALSFNGS